MNHFSRIQLIIIILLPVLSGSCKKEEVKLPVIPSSEVMYVRRTLVDLEGSVKPGADSILDCGFCWNTTGMPTLSDSTVSKMYDSEGHFEVYIQYLKPATTYFTRAYATTLTGTTYGQEKTFTTMPVGETIIFNPGLTYGSVTDIDGNVYKTIEIGTQTWMAENLRTTRYNDNTEIALVTDNKEWENLKTAAYCWYEKNEEVYKDLYGGYYNGYAVITEKLCPDGWHVPSNDEWLTLGNYLGVSTGDRGTDEALKLKESGNHNWYLADNINGTNDTGFTGLPGGFRMGYDGGNIGAEGYVAFWWSSGGYPKSDWLFDRWILFNQTDLKQDSRILTTGMNVRCIRD